MKYNQDDQFIAASSALSTALKTWDSGEGTGTVVSLAKRILLLGRQSNNSSGLEQAARLLQKALSVALADTAGPRGHAIVSLAVLLLRAYWTLGASRLAANVVRAVDNSGAADLASPRADRITWEYFRGRLCLDSLDWAGANDHFTSALRQCFGVKAATGNNNYQRLLVYAVIARISVNGKVPSQMALASGILPSAMNPMIAAVRAGDPAGLERAIEQHRAFWMTHRLYLIALHQLRTEALRNLVRVTARALGLLVDARVPLGAWHAACRLRVDQNMEADEAEALLAGLIAAERVRGYISREHETLVLSKRNPFP